MISGPPLLIAATSWSFATNAVHSLTGGLLTLPSRVTHPPPLLPASPARFGRACTPLPLGDVLLSQLLCRAAGHLQVRTRLGCPHQLRRGTLFQRLWHVLLLLVSAVFKQLGGQRDKDRLRMHSRIHGPPWRPVPCVLRWAIQSRSGLGALHLLRPGQLPEQPSGHHL